MGKASIPRVKIRSSLLTPYSLLLTPYLSPLTPHAYCLPTPVE
jgi:hypothetical protein